MGRVRVQARTGVPVADAEALWYDLTRWPNFVDGFSHVARRDQDWPGSGTLVWDSHPGGRGRVVERVVSYAQGIGQDVEVEDEKLTGTQCTRFTADAISLELDYRLKEARPGLWLVDALFIRRALRDSLRRTAVRFAIELRAERELTGESIA